MGYYSMLILELLGLCKLEERGPYFLIFIKEVRIKILSSNKEYILFLRYFDNGSNDWF
jgi:hypothetical protein